MKSVLHPGQMLLLILAGWINQQQQNAIEYLIAENRILREKIGKKRILLTDDQRRRLAVKGKVLGGKALAEICSIAMPETILRWYRELIAKKWDYSKCRKKAGRPSTEKEAVELVVQMAKENCGWGYNRIQGRWQILATRYPTQPSEIFSKSMELNRRRSVRGKRPGRHSFKRTGMFWLP